MRLSWKINSHAWHSKKKWFPGHDNLRSCATPIHHHPPYSPPVRSTHTHTHTQAYTHNTDAQSLAGPFCCGEERCYLTVPSSIPLVIIYSVFTGRFELVIYFPFGAFLPFSLLLVHTQGIPRPLTPSPLRPTPSAVNLQQIRQKLKRSGFFSPPSQVVTVLSDWNTFKHFLIVVILYYTDIAAIKLHREEVCSISNYVEFIYYLYIWQKEDLIWT